MNEKILIIDDDPEILDMLETILTREDYDVLRAEKGEEALALFQSNPIDLVITDMTMPKLNGDQLARRMMSIRPQIPVILCTGFHEDISEEKALAMGIDKFVMKPIVKDKLASTIRAVLDNRSALPN